MTMLKAMVFALAAAVIVFVGVGWALADEWRVETARRIQAPPARIGALLTDLGSWSKWSAVSIDMGPQTKVEVSGQPHVTGQAITWSGAHGVGRMRVESVTDGAIDYVVESRGAGASDWKRFSEGRIEWRADGDGCATRWLEHRRCDSLPERWFAWFGAAQEVVRGMQVSSLTGLQQECEATPTGGAK